jgi:uncharacterized membrane protein
MEYFWFLLVIWIILYVCRWMFVWPWHGRRRHWHDDENGIVRRYARSEISKKEYRELLKDLDDTKD